jgi:hypothetical protein
MSKRKWAAAKLFAVLGGAGLAIGICAPRVSIAQPPPFTAANYANRYECNVTSDENFYTAVMLLYPNGAGTYTNGTLVAAGGRFFAFDPAMPPEANTCSYSLILPSSAYVVSANGFTTEVLSWMADAANNAACPVSTPPLGSFVMSNTTALRANVTAAGVVQNEQITSGNLLDFPFPGYGQCLK